MQPTSQVSVPDGVMVEALRQELARLNDECFRLKVELQFTQSVLAGVVAATRESTGEADHHHE